MVENAELQPSYGGNQANIKTVLKKQNKTVKGGYFFKNINVTRKHTHTKKIYRNIPD